MKFTNTPAALIITLCFALFPGISFSALAPSMSEIYPADAELADLFGVAVTKEPIYIILVEKNLQRLRVLEYDNELRVVAEYPSATGENSGIKEISGDSKTPEGIYFITQIFRDDKITIFGDKAFHLDYPNFYDREAGRNGDGIYIHGTNKELVPNSTNGCITLANNDLDDLEIYLNQAVTPVVIVQELDSITKSKTKLLTENDFLLAKSMLLPEELKPDNVDYNSLYIVNLGNQTVAVSDFIYRPFERSIMRGASRIYLHYLPDEGWTAGKRIWRVSPLQIYPETPFKVAAQPLANAEVQLAEQTQEEAVAMVAALNPQSLPQKKPAQLDTDLSGQKPGLLQPLVQQEPKSAPVAPVVEKASQVQQAVPVTIRPPKPAPPTNAANKTEEPSKIMAAAPVIPNDKQQIMDFVEKWRQAWVSQETDSYIAFYDKTFRSGGKNLAEWKTHKAELNKTYAFISVDISNIQVSWTAEGATVSFKQKYRSDRYSATGNKTLFLKYSEHGWKIKREVYSRI